jgi:hypothetical protein
MSGMELDATLPRIDAHEVSVDAPALVAWSAVLAVFGRVTTGPVWRTFARAVRCTPDRATGSLDAAGAAMPGFLVARCEIPTEWALEGQHFFSRYALTFGVAPIDGAHCRITAQSSAAFPGAHGKMYRALVIGTGGHLIGVRGLLRTMKAEAERGGD